MRSNAPPHGGVEALDARHTLPVWLQAAGYRTSHIGKYLNGYGLRRKPPTCRRAGATGTAPSTRAPTRCTATRCSRTACCAATANFDVEDPALYQTDVLRQKAVESIEATGPDTPLFLSLIASSRRTARSRTPAARRSPTSARRRATSARSSDLREPASFRASATSATSRPTSAACTAPNPATATRVRADFRARRESLLAVDEAVARGRRRARAHRAARLDLHPLHLRQRLLPGRAPHRQGQVPRLRPVDARAAADPRPGHRARDRLRRAGGQHRPRADAARRGRREPRTPRSTAARSCPSRAIPGCARGGPCCTRGSCRATSTATARRARTGSRATARSAPPATCGSSGRAARASSTTSPATRARRTRATPTPATAGCGARCTGSSSACGAAWATVCRQPVGPLR